MQNKICDAGCTNCVQQPHINFSQCCNTGSQPPKELMESGRNGFGVASEKQKNIVGSDMTSALESNRLERFSLIPLPTSLFQVKIQIRLI